MEKSGELVILGSKQGYNRFIRGHKGIVVVLVK